ncbi:transmembrane amino acid transporter protein-domain-containing protein [Gongronella butleri]|nr:transmembrane amino acid transporter protein-domain-containing protein [Gongronella butleri]
MGAAAFGEKGRKMISTVFILELMTIGVIGVISSTFLIVLVVYDGLSKTEHPGSLHDPLPTNMWPDYATLPLSFGIFMAGYSGHAVFPSIYRDMAQPKEYTRVVDYTYLITFVLYMTMITTGYLMFGNDIMQEITRNLAVTEGYSVWLNHAAAYINLLMPIAKYGLMLNPIVVSGELWLQSKGGTEDDTLPSWIYAPVSFLGRIALSACILVISIAIPGFDRVIALLGALFSYGISVIFPLACYIKLYRKDLSFHALYANWALLLVSAVLAIIGTVWSFIPL